MTRDSDQARRYVAVIQDARGYPAPGAPLEPGPPEGVGPPVIHSVVLADDHERVERERDKLADIIARASRLCEQGDPALVQQVLREAADHAR